VGHKAEAEIGTGQEAEAPRQEVGKTMSDSDTPTDRQQPDIFRGQWWFWTTVFRVLFWIDRR
jgi:hypothetical protein